ncbi:MAG: general secretion pathway protein G [Candidatus Pelagisphaera sp.]|jgi:general secretion pathway protein G
MKPEDCITRPRDNRIRGIDPHLSKVTIFRMKTDTLRNRKINSNKHGFTLIEIMLVIGLMVMLVGLTVYNIDKILGGNKDTIAEMKVKSSFKTPLTTYKIHMGRYPTTAQGLKALLTPPEGGEKRWRGPYINEAGDLLDPWFQDLQYRSPGTNNKSGYDLFSLGEDGTESADDITNW